MILVHCYLIKYISFFGTRLFFSSSSSRFLYFPAKEAHVLYVAFSFFAITLCECTCPRFVSEKSRAITSVIYCCIRNLSGNISFGFSYLNPFASRLSAIPSTISSNLGILLSFNLLKTRSPS